MTYEQFEYQVINMLLVGEDPRLEKFRQQIWHLEVLSRYETASGFVTTFTAPPSLASAGVRSKFSGMTIEVLSLGKMEVELVVENGLISSLRGTFSGDVTYSEILANVDHLRFYYRNGKSSDIYFYSNLTPTKADPPPFEEVEEPVEDVIDASEDLSSQVVSEVESSPIDQEAILDPPPLEILDESTQLDEEISNPVFSPPQASSPTSRAPMTLGELVGYDSGEKATIALPVNEEVPSEIDEKNRQIQQSLDSLVFDGEEDQEVEMLDVAEKRKRRIRLAIVVICFLIGGILGVISMTLILGIEIPFISDLPFLN